MRPKTHHQFTRGFQQTASFVLLVIAAFDTRGMSTNTQHIAALVTHIEATRRANEPWWDDANVFIEGYGHLLRMPEFAELEKLSESTYRSVMKDLPAVASTEISQTVLFLSYRSLSPDSYVGFLDKAVDYAAKGVVSKKVLKWILTPEEGPMDDVLADNYQHPLVRSILERARKIFADDPKMASYYASYLSGEMRRNLDRARIDAPFDISPSWRHEIKLKPTPEK